MTSSSQTIDSANIKITNTNCDHLKIISSIGIALGIIIALGGVLAFIAISFPHALGPLNALSHLTYTGATILAIAGIALIALALFYVCKKHGLSETTKKEVAQIVADIRQELTEENISKLPARDSIVAYLHKYQQNSTAISSLVSEIIKLPHAYEIAEYLLTDDLGMEDETPDSLAKLLSAILSGLRTQPSLFKKFIEKCYCPSLEKHSDIWYAVYDLNTEEVNDLVSQEYALHKNLQADSCHIFGYMQNIQALLKLVVRLNHKEQCSKEKRKEIPKHALKSSDIQKIYRSLIQNFPKIEMNTGRIVDFALAIRAMVATLKKESDPDTENLIKWMIEDFKQYFPKGWENTSEIDQLSV